MYKNAVNLIGFLGKDAEVKAAQENSTNFTVLSLAIKESWKNKQTNEWESRTEWHRILVFGKLGDFAATLTKGAHIEVEGALRSREQMVELKGSSKKNPETKNVRSWLFVRNLFASSIALRSPVKMRKTFRFDHMRERRHLGGKRCFRNEHFTLIFARVRAPVILAQ